LRVPDWDPARHIGAAFSFYDAIRAGDLLEPFTAWTAYPPVVHIVGAAGLFFMGEAVWAPVVALNVVFVPLLAVGCYQTGRLVYGDAWAGALAVLYALGVPMVVGQFHVFMTDAPETAMVAVSVWLLLASRNFEDPKFAAGAGAAVGIGMLTKEPFPMFVAGVVLVMLARGGWRNGRGLLAFAAIVAIVAGPWYLEHFGDLSELARTPLDRYVPTPQQSPPRVSGANATWYAWAGANYQVLAPLLAFTIVGVLLALRRLLRRAPGHSLTVELLCGAFIAWLGVSLTVPHDARYSLPALVYLAVLGTGWIVSRPRVGRLLAVTLLVAIVAANVTGASTGLGERVAIVMPGGQGNGFAPHQVSLYADDGFVFGKPVRGGDLLSLMHRLRASGVREIRFDSKAAYTGLYNLQGLFIIARVAGLEFAAFDDSARPLAADEVLLVHRKIPTGHRPCEDLGDGTGVWAYRGAATVGRRVEGCPISPPG
jgi:hypothetical protein